MFKLLLKNILFNKSVAPVALRIALKAHNFFYDIAGVLAVVVNGGVHPKHRILRYKEWFLDHISSESTQ